MANHSGARLAVGLMSGTSMDGIDAALVSISGPAAKPRVKLVEFVTRPYPKPIRERLLEVAGGAPTATAEVSELNFLLGELFAEAALEACRRGRVSPDRVSVIGSHGQTIFHQGTHGRLSVTRHSREGGNPSVSEKHWIPAYAGMTTKGPLSVTAYGAPSTLQIASPAVIAQRTGVPVVSDFRAADMAAGGQGAPLVPMVDYLLLRDARLGSVALNIGGIANVTVIPAKARPEDVIGFDTGPGNMVIDALVRHTTNGRKSYDSGGGMAARGKVIEAVLDRALRHPFFQAPPPKSAGREQFGAEFVSRCFLGRRGVHANDLIRTASELTARTVVDALKRFVLPTTRLHRLIISGGGAHNPVLVQRLRELLPTIRVQLSVDFGLPVDAKEAMAFALLADRTMRGLSGNLPSVTGARDSVVLGQIANPIEASSGRALSRRPR